MAPGSKYSEGLTWGLRTCGLMNLLMGAFLLVYAMVLQYPVNDALPIFMILLGVCSLLCAIAAIMLRSCGHVLLDGYLIATGVLTLVELCVGIAFFAAAGSIADDLGGSSDTQDEVDGGRYFLLLGVLAQAAALGAAVVFRFKTPPERAYEDFEAGQARQHVTSAQAQVQMEALKASIGGASPARGTPPPGAGYTSSPSLQRSVTRTMDAKYGAHAPDVVLPWYKKLPGMR